mmetsp:Transcript_30763/g.49118  ORF Transcript_30763/g.49118 Transcript_30763/m.49118 type:complete len:275 (-) Transcript_30763:244-1068(-)
MKLSPDMSRWQFRKNHRKHAASVDKIYISYLQSLLQYNDIMYDSRFAFEHNTTFPIKLEHPLNLERYSEDPKCDIQSQQKVCNVGDTDIPSAIGLHTGHHAVVSTPERGVDALQPKSVPSGSSEIPRCKTDPLQCQVCRLRFNSRNALFDHLSRDCLKDGFARKGQDDKDHRRRWRARTRNRRRLGRGGSTAELSSSSAQPSGSSCGVSRTMEPQSMIGRKVRYTCSFGFPSGVRDDVQDVVILDTFVSQGRRCWKIRNEVGRVWLVDSTMLEI